MRANPRLVVDKIQTRLENRKHNEKLAVIAREAGIPYPTVQLIARREITKVQFCDICLLWEYLFENTIIDFGATE